MSTTSISQTMNSPPISKPTRTLRFQKSWIDKKPLQSSKIKVSFFDKQLSVAAPTNFYAGPSFTDSPLPQKVPLPPSQWFENNTAQCVCDSCSFCESYNSSSQSESIAARLCSIQSLDGLRLTPLQLIAAVAS